MHTLPEAAAGDGLFVTVHAQDIPVRLSTVPDSSTVL